MRSEFLVFSLLLHVHFGSEEDMEDAMEKRRVKNIL